MTFFLMPKNHTFLKRRYFRMFILLAAGLADRIIVVSNSTRRDFLKRFPTAENKVATIPLGKPALPLVRGGLKVFAGQPAPFDIEQEYILFIGTLEPRKNVTSLISAYHRLNQSKPRGPLVIVGAKGWDYEETFQLVSRLGIGEKVIFTGFIDDCEKFALLQNATVFVYPSFYEGFGLPVLEALSLGVPTIASNVSSMPEVAGDAALLVDPRNVEELANALNTLLENPILRRDMSIKGIEQAGKFNWERTARETIGVYNDAVQAGR